MLLQNETLTQYSNNYFNAFKNSNFLLSKFFSILMNFLLEIIGPILTIYTQNKKEGELKSIENLRK
jgi:hypothetical protein